MLSEVREEFETGDYSDCFVNILAGDVPMIELQDMLDRFAEEIPQLKHAGISFFPLVEVEHTEELKFSFFFFEKSHVLVVDASDSQDSVDGAVNKIRDAMESVDNVAGVAIYPSGASIEASRLMEEVSLGYEEIPFFGALAYAKSFALESNLEDSRLYTIGNAPRRFGVSAAIFYGEELNIRGDYVFGWNPIGKEMEINLARKGEVGDTNVSDIDGVPAAMIFKKYLGVLPTNDLMFNVCEFPITTFRNGWPMARVPFHTSEDGNLQLMGDLKKGEKIRFTYGRRENVLTASKEGSLRMKRFAPEGMIVYICGNRTIFLRDEADTEIEYYMEVCDSAETVHGMCELYRQYGGGGVLNSALVSIGFREGGARCSCDRDFDFEMELFKPEGTVLALEDRLVSFLEAMTEEFSEMTKEADVANKAKSAFLSNMSHEIRTPINVILGMDEIVMRESKEPEVVSYANDIYAASKTLLSLVNDILDFSKIESGKMEIIPMEYDLSSLIHDMENMTVVRANEKGLKLELEVDSKLPSRLYGDDIRLRQVLTNILTNAVKYTREGTIWFRVSGHSFEGDEILRFEVEDTGIGIKQEDIPRLFEKFSRIDEKKNRTIEGTGLGMNITTTLLELMNSRIEVESEYGKGSKFYFDICQTIIDDTPIGNLEDRVKRLKNKYHHEETFTAPDARILVVDDNEMNIKVFMRLLRDTEMKIDKAMSGRESLVLASKNKYDIIFLDHMMPGMDGIETLHEMRRDENSPNKDTPVYMLTANAVAGAEDRYLKEGFSGFVPKPIDSVRLEETVRAALPEEYIRPATKLKDKDVDVKKEKVLKDLPVITGLDWNYAWMHLPAKDLMENAFAGFYSMIDVHSERLEKHYSALLNEESEENFNSYRIQVHGMKSSAATIGIFTLSGMAQTLESAAAEKNIAVIRAMHSIFINEWNTFSDKLKGVFGLGHDAGVKQTVNRELIKSFLEVLNKAMEEFDVDKSDEIIDKLHKYEFEGELEAEVKKLSTAAFELDIPGVREISEHICDILNA